MSNTLESLEARRLLAGTGAISGSVYTDLNANAKHEAGEAGITKARLFLDMNNNGLWDSKTEASVPSDKRGQFKFTGLSAGTYRLREVTAGSVAITAPRSDWFKIKLADGQHVARRMFGNAVILQIPTSIDLNDNDAVHGYVTTAARTGGLWSSPGITSTAAKNATPVNHILGTLSGAEFHGAVNYDDYAHISNGSHSGWFSGDFDLQGSVSFDDYTLIDMVFNGQNSAVVPPTTPATPSIRSIAMADFKLTHNDHSLLNAKSWLSGHKDVLRSPGLQTVIDHYHQYGIDYKREFLRLASGY